ncbi:MAG: hypothetical protein ABW022_19560, partial [Actinoplanes sp.]
MEPTSSPDNDRPPRGLARFWPVQRDTDDETAADESATETVARTSETQMVALGSRQNGSFELGPIGAGGFGQGPAQPVASTANQDRGPDNPQPPREQPSSLPSPAAGPGGLSHTPSQTGQTPGQTGQTGRTGQVGQTPAGQHEARGGDPDHSGASDTSEDAAQAVESGRSHPWERDFGGFGLGGRNGRFLFGGRNPAEPRAAVNGHGTEVNGRSSTPDAPPSTVDDPAPGPTAHRASDSDENGRDDMNGRAGVPGFPKAGESGPAEENGKPDLSTAAGRRRDLGDTPVVDQRRQAAGWASVPTSTNPIVSPISGAPSSGAPAASTPLPPAPPQPSKPAQNSPLTNGP